MAPRRAYNKSTSGCTTCKSRKVKCDENRPACGSCVRRQDLCVYTSTVSNSGYTTAPQDFPTMPGILSGSAATLTPFSVDCQENGSRLLEMRLISHCTVMTFNTVAIINEVARREVWSTEIFRLAFQSEHENPLLDILLGLSATHLRLLNPSDNSLVSASHYYHSRGLQKCNDLMPQINDASCPLLFASSILIALHLLLVRQTIRPTENYEVPLAWFSALRGVNTIVSAKRTSIAKSMLCPLLFDISQSDVINDTEYINISQSLLTRLTETANQTHIGVYEDAIGYLRRIYVSYLANGELNSFRQILLAFPGKVPELFLSLLAQHEPNALVITAYFFELLKIVEQDIWWLQGVPEREITGLLTILPVDWLWAVESIKRMPAA